MNSFLDISLPAANSIFNAANIILIMGCVLVAVGTVANVWSAGIRDRYADERISSNEAETARANESAAVASQKAAEAELKLEQFKAPRSFSSEQVSRIVQALKPFAATHFDAAIITSDPEAENLLLQIEHILATAQWIQIDWKGGDVVYTRLNRRVVGIVSVPGVIIQMRSENVKKFEAAAVALQNAFTSEGITTKAEGGVGGYPNQNNDVLHILVGKKQ